MSISDDRFEILNQLARFARIIDGKQWDAIGDVFADDVVFDYGDDGEHCGLAALRGQFRRYLDQCGATQHLLGSVHVEIDGDDAVTQCYVQARHQGKGALHDRFIDTSGDYRDAWRRGAEGWRIVRRDASWAFHKGDFAVLTGDGAIDPDG